MTEIYGQPVAFEYIMWMAATAIPEWGLTPFLVPHLTSAVYYATPENNWNELLLPPIPDWIIVYHEFTPIKNFFEGAPQGQSVPWMVWLWPLAYWIPFLLALCLAMVRDGDRGTSLIKPFFKSGLMWVGFSIPAIFHSFNGLNHYFPFIPPIMPEGVSIPLFRGTVGIGFILNFQMIGFSYFISREIAFGLCFFHLLNIVQQGIFNTMGIQRVDSIYELRSLAF